MEDMGVHAYIWVSQSYVADSTQVDNQRAKIQDLFSWRSGH